jgi:hypothetical protein
VDYFRYIQESALSEQSPNRRKFAQSGHPAQKKKGRLKSSHLGPMEGSGLKMKGASLRLRRRNLRDFRRFLERKIFEPARRVNHLANFPVRFVTYDDTGEPMLRKFVDRKIRQPKNFSTEKFVNRKIRQPKNSSTENSLTY